MSPLNCEEFESLSAEFVLGVLPGDQRGLALTHLAACPTCRAQTRELARVADSLLLLTTPAEPPSGFESKVLTRIGLEQSPPDRRKRIRAVRLAAAAVLVAVIGTVGVVAGRLTRGSTATHLGPNVALVRNNDGTCQVASLPANGGMPAMLIVRLDEPSEPPGPYPVQLVAAKGGALVPWGVIQVRDGHGSLQGTVPAGVGKVRGIRVLDGNTVRYRATFAPI